jgi:hypothetical protein
MQARGFSVAVLVLSAASASAAQAAIRSPVVQAPAAQSSGMQSGAVHPAGAQSSDMQSPAVQPPDTQSPAAPLPAASPSGCTATCADSEIAPFSAHYQADWKSINVGTSDLVLVQDNRPNHYVYTWTTTARGVFRILYSSDVVYKSWFGMSAGRVRPEKYRATEGSSSVSVDFDWDRRTASGQSEGKPVDFKLEPGTQDLASIQVQVMQDLKVGTLPAIFHIVDKDELKDFIYTREGSARIRTALGELDTVIVASQSKGSDRILRMWFAPSLGFVPVQAERTRNGKLEFAMRIKTLKR